MLCYDHVSPEENKKVSAEISVLLTEPPGNAPRQWAYLWFFLANCDDKTVQPKPPNLQYTGTLAEDVEMACENICRDGVGGREVLFGVFAKVR